MWGWGRGMSSDKENHTSTVSFHRSYSNKNKATGSYDVRIYFLYMHYFRLYGSHAHMLTLTAGHNGVCLPTTPILSLLCWNYIHAPLTPGIFTCVLKMELRSSCLWVLYRAILPTPFSLNLTLFNLNLNLTLHLHLYSFYTYITFTFKTFLLTAEYPTIWLHHILFILGSSDRHESFLRLSY